MNRITQNFNIRPSHQMGVGLIDVMIAVFIFSVGLLAISALQLISKQSNYEAIQRTSASALANDILEKMRMNSSDFVSSTTQSSLIYYASTNPILKHTVPVVKPAPECDSAVCTPEQLAAWDLYEWKLMLIGAGETDKDSDTKYLGGLVDPTACITGPATAPGTGASGVYTVSIAWRGQTKLSQTAATSGNTCGAGVYDDGSDLNAFRRLVQIEAYLDSD